MQLMMERMSKFKAIGSSLLVIMLMYFSQMLAYMTASVALLIGMPTLLYYIIAGVIYFSLFLVLSKVVFEKVMHMEIFDFGIVPFSVKPIWVIIGIMLPLSVIGIAITGGDFGIESSAIAFILYVIVAIIALYMIKNRDR